MRTTLTGYAFHPWMQSGAKREATLYDHSLVENMTEWIQNDTVKLYIQSYLMLCPGQEDMCFGKQYKRNYSFQFSYRSCDQCQCRNDCRRANNCCPWRFYRQDKDKTPNYISYQNHNQNTVSKYGNVPLKCVIPQANARSIKPGILSYYMISSCPHNYDNSVIIQKCEHSFQVKNIFLYQPYFSLLSNETFRNLECAICNGEPLDKLIPWSPSLVCAREKALLRTNTLSYLQSIVFYDKSLCNIVFAPPVTRTQTKLCVVEQRYVSGCNKTGLWKTFDKTIFNACNSNFVDVYLDCSVLFERKLYKNIYCAMCNIENWRKELTIECKSSVDVFDLQDLQYLVSFSALIDFRKLYEVKSVSKNQDSQCPEDSLYEPRLVSVLNSHS